MKLKFVPLVIIICCIFLCCDNTGAEDKKSPAISTSFSIAQLEQALKQFPDSVKLVEILVDSLQEAQRFSEAEALLQGVIRKDSINAYAWYKLALVKLAQKDTASAIKNLTLAVRWGPELDAPRLERGFLLAEKQDPEALQIATQLLQHAKDPAVLTQARFLKGIYHYNRREFSPALSAFDDCILADYTFLDAYVGKGMILYEKKDYANAAGVFQQALNVSSSFAEAWYWLGKCNEATKKNEEAIDCYQKALALDPGLYEARDGLTRLGK